MSTDEPGMVAKASKPQFHLVEFEFVRHMAAVLSKPIIEGKYTSFGWQRLDSAKVKEMYFDSLMRHVAAAQEGEYLDESGEPHWAAVAVNAMILWWHQRKEQKT
jgi:hypothetical protein